MELARGANDMERTCASFGLPVSKATLTHHFRVLREAGLIRQVDRGNSRAAKLRREELDRRRADPPAQLDLAERVRVAQSRDTKGGSRGER